MDNFKKILILVPAVTARGGISNYYQVLRNEFPDEIEFFERGARTWPVRKGFLYEMIRAWKDYRSFKYRLAQNDISLVQTSTSLSLFTTIRDGLFIRYAGKRNIKTIVFFRGWNEKRAENTEKVLPLFRHFLFGADAFIALSVEAENQLRKWGYKKPIYAETTLVDKELLKYVTTDSIREKYQSMFNQKTVRLLFISRIEKYKGIYDLLTAFTLLQQGEKQPIFTLTVCGDGFELDHLKNKIKAADIKNIQLEGFVSGDKKREVFEKAHIMIFPSYSEGMPNTVLEAMGFGIPVLTTRVGGINDFFIPGENGYFIEKENPSDIAENINRLLSNPDVFRQMALTNFSMANEKFRSDKVCERMLDIFRKTINASHHHR